jgi:hypothetical protein
LLLEAYRNQDRGKREEEIGKSYGVWANHAFYTGTSDISKNNRAKF